MISILYELLYYSCIACFGVYISMKLSCGVFSVRHWKLFGLSSAVLLLIQGVCSLLLGLEAVRMLYPLITHLPLMLLLILYLKTRWDIAFTSVITSYALCQLPRWIGLVFAALPLQPFVIYALHLLGAALFLLFLDRFLLLPIHKVLLSSSNAVINFGAPPIVYYIYEYFMIYTHQRYADMQAFSELLPTALVLFFTLAVAVYHQETETRKAAEHQLSMLETELSHAAQVIETLRGMQEQTAVYRHDMHHHLAVLDHHLAANQPQQAAQYIHQIQSGLEDISPMRCCENEIINLVLGLFTSKARSVDIPFIISAAVPDTLNFPDTELCALLSNGLENAFNAAEKLPSDADRTIRFTCEIRQNTLLICIRNPYVSQPAFQNGLPVARDQNPHYGCRSIQTIVQRRNGLCSFETQENQFVLKIAIPILEA